LQRAIHIAVNKEQQKYTGLIGCGDCVSEDFGERGVWLHECW